MTYSITCRAKRSAFELITALPSAPTQIDVEDDPPAGQVQIQHDAAFGVLEAEIGSDKDRRLAEIRQDRSKVARKLPGAR